MCAIGRCFIDAERFEGQDYNVFSPDHKLKMEHSTTFEDQLKEQYKGYSKDFWHNLQRLHYRSWYWTENGITENGMKYAKELIKRYESE